MPSPFHGLAGRLPERVRTGSVPATSRQLQVLVSSWVLAKGSSVQVRLCQRRSARSYSPCLPCNDSCRFCTGFCCAFVTRRHRECLWPCGLVAAALTGEAHLAGRFDEPSWKHLQLCHLADVLADTGAPCLAGPSGAASGRRRRIRLTGKTALPTQLPSPCRVPARAHRSRASSAKSTRPSATSPGGQAAPVPCLNLLLTGAGCAAGPSHACHQARSAPCQRIASCAPAIAESWSEGGPPSTWRHGRRLPICRGRRAQRGLLSCRRNRNRADGRDNRCKRCTAKVVAARVAKRPPVLSAQVSHKVGGLPCVAAWVRQAACMRWLRERGGAWGRSCVRQKLCRCIMRWWGAGCTTGCGSTTQQHTHSVMPQTCGAGRRSLTTSTDCGILLSPRSKT